MIIYRKFYDVTYNSCKLHLVIHVRGFFASSHNRMPSLAFTTTHHYIPLLHEIAPFSLYNQHIHRQNCTVSGAAPDTFKNEPLAP